MKKGRFNLLVAILIVFGSCYIISGLIIGGVFTHKTTYKEAEASFRKHFTEFSIVAKYMEELPEEHVFCEKSHGYDVINKGAGQGWQDIKEEVVCQAIQCLFNEGSCTSISKTKSTISFVLFSKNMDVGGGIAYTASDKLEVEYLSFSQVLSDSSWYYYVSDYNEWRLQQ